MLNEFGTQRRHIVIIIIDDSQLYFLFTLLYLFRDSAMVHFLWFSDYFICLNKILLLYYHDWTYCPILIIIIFLFYFRYFTFNLLRHFSVTILSHFNYLNNNIVLPVYSVGFCI